MAGFFVCAYSLQLMIKRSNIQRSVATFFTLVLAVAITACSQVDVSSLPDVPRVRFDTFLPGVQTQLTAAYAAVDDKPASIEANGHLAMLLQTYKQFDAAGTMYARTRALDPATFKWTYLHAVVQGATGDPDAAIETLRHALTLTEDYPMAKIRLADHLAERGDTLEAARLFEDVIATAQPMSETYFSHGQFLLRNNQARQAIAAFREALRLGGNLGAAHYQLGLAHRALGERDEAAEQFALAKQHEGYSADSADRVLNQLLPLNLSDTPFVHRARVLAESGRFDEAQRFIEMALERNPDSVAAHASMIGMAARNQDFAAVDVHFKRAAELEPGNAKIYFNLGMARIAEARFVEATQAFKDAIERDDSDPNAHVQLAILRHKRGDVDSARAGLSSALALEPAHQTANWLMGELSFEGGDAAAAAAHLTRATAQAHALRPLMRALLAEAQLALGQTDAAVATIEAAQAELGDVAGAGMRERVANVASKVRDAAGAVPDAP